MKEYFHLNPIHHIKEALNEAQQGLSNLISDDDTLFRVQRASELMIQSLQSRGRIFSCGNGGSMCDAMHFAEELTGRFRKDRQAFAAIAISDASHMSCVGNDYGYEFVFSRYLEAHGRAGDTLVAISTSGSSRNILAAAKTAKSLGMNVIGLTGRKSAVLAETSDVHIATPCGEFADRIQELHIKVIHIFIELIERGLAPSNYTE